MKNGEINKVFNKLFVLTLLPMLVVSCKPVPVSHWFPETPQEQYEKDLYKNKAEKTIAGATWFGSAKAVLTDTLITPVPYQERFFLGDSTPAQTIRFTVPEGRSLIVTPLADDTSAHLFVELYRIKDNGKRQRIGYLKEGQTNISSDDHNGDTLLLRIQTGLAETQRATVTLTTTPTLSFPVAGLGMQNVISYWGAERDRGTRAHEGIDISARRGTPAIASADGYVSQVGTNNLGGKVVFLSAANLPYSIYYAHLDSQLVSFGTRVVRGDTLGLVGNTGNAITTAPHLHFGIYARGAGAVDPLPFINDRKEKLPGLPEASRYLGDSVKVRKKTNVFADATFSLDKKITTIPANTTVFVLGEMAKGYRVILPNGTKGYIPTTTLVIVKRDQFSTTR